MEQPTYQPAQQTNTMAVVSLVLGILGLIGVLPLIGSVGAIITGNMAQKEIAGAPGRYSGDGIAKGGLILGWIGVGLGALVCCAGIAWFTILGGSAFLFGDRTGLLPALLSLV